MEYYKKEGKKYVYVGESTPYNLAEGVWLVQRDGNRRQHIAKIGELKDIYPYAQMMQDRDILAEYLQIKITQYISDTVKVTSKGSFQYTFPSSSEMAKDILLFLSKTPAERHDEITHITNSIKTIDKDGNILDGQGRIIHHAYTKEALYLLIKDLEQHLHETRQLLGERCVNEI